MPNDDSSDTDPFDGDQSPRREDAPLGQSPGGPPDIGGRGPGLPGAGTFDTGDLDPRQAKALTQIIAAAQLCRKQKRGARKAGRARTKGFKAAARYEHHAKEVELAAKDHDEVRALPLPQKRFNLPRWTALVWVPLCLVMLTPIEQRFVAFLPGLSAISLQAALFLSVTLEALAWWLGRSMAARFESIAPLIELKDTEKLALRVALPLAVTVQGGLLVLRLIRTGQVASTVALTVAALAVLAVSCFVHDASCSGREAEQRHLARIERRHGRRLRRAAADFDKARGAWHHATEHLMAWPAGLIVARIYEIASSTDALIRSRPGGIPGRWPVLLLVAKQMELARSILPDSLRFPDEPWGRPGSAVARG